MPASPAYSFESAQERVTATSSALSAARSGADASRSSAAAVSGLNLPIVSIDAQYFRYQKTIDIGLESVRTSVLNAVNGFLGSLPVPLPPLPPSAVNSIVPESFTAKVTENIWRPTLTVLWPLYTGGLSDATQSAAEAGARQAEAELVATSDTLTLQLVVAYFGQQVTAHTLETSRQNLARFQTHLDNALKMEAQGLLSKAQRLQMQVARDAAERQALRAQNDHETALAVLTRTLNEGRVVQPLTPLFAASAPLPPLQGFVDTGRMRSPTVARLIALREVADSGVKAAEAASLPRLYGFGSYNFNARNAVLPDPDWIVGVGLHYPIFSNVDRKQSESAARARQQQAQTSVDQARNDVETLIVRSYQGVETARRQFLLLSSNIEAAEENVRVQTLGFREGEATAAALIDAQVALSVAQTQRAAAAFEYDVSLARLLAASGQMADYGRHVAAADQRVPLP